MGSASAGKEPRPAGRNPRKVTLRTSRAHARIRRLQCADIVDGVDVVQRVTSGFLAAVMKPASDATPPRPSPRSRTTLPEKSSTVRPTKRAREEEAPTASGLVSMVARAASLGDADADNTGAARILANVLGDGFSPLPPLLLYGVRGTRKARTLISLLEALRMPHCAVSCTDFDSSKSIMQAVATAFAHSEMARLDSPSTDSSREHRRESEPLGPIRSGVTAAGAGAGIALCAAVHHALSFPALLGPHAVTPPLLAPTTAAEALLRRRTLAEVARSRGTGIDRFGDLVRTLREVASPDRCSVLVFTAAERLLDIDSALIPALLRLSELTHRALCPVFVAESPVGLVAALEPSDRRPRLVHFPAPSPDAVLTIMCETRPSDAPEPLFRQFAKQVRCLLPSSVPMSPGIG